MALTPAEQQELAQLEAKYSKPKASSLSPQEADELAALEAKYGESPREDRGLLGKGLDYSLRALDYAGGAARYAGAGLANIPYSMATGKSLTKTDDLGKVLKGQAPTTAEYMERGGVPEGPRFNLSPMEGDTSLRDIAGFAGDIATDPLTYTGLPLVKGAKKLLNVGGDTAESVGKSIYRSGFKKIDERLAEKGKKKIADVLLESGAPAGTTKKLAKNMQKVADTALKQRDELYKKATDLGVTVDLRFPLEQTEELLSKARTNPGMRAKVDELSDLLMEYKNAGKVDLQTLSDWKSALYEALPASAFGPDGKAKGIYSKFEKALATDFKDAIISAGNKAEKGLGSKIDEANEIIGSVLTAKQPTKIQIRRGETPNFFTSVDAILGGVGAAKALPLKKGADLAKTTYARTKVGKGLMRAGQSGLIDPAARRGLIDANRD